MFVFGVFMCASKGFWLLYFFKVLYWSLFSVSSGFFFRDLELALFCFVFRDLTHALHAHGRMAKIEILRCSCRFGAELV